MLEEILDFKKLEGENQRRDEISRNICALGMRKNKTKKQCYRGNIRFIKKKKS